MSTRLEQQVVCVTGAGRGIGREIALLAGSLGARVVVADYGGAVDTATEALAPVAEAVAHEIIVAGGEAVGVADDVSTMSGGEHIVETAVTHFGRIDAMVCVAGILIESDFLELTEDEWDRAMSVHLKGHFSCLQAASRRMLAQGGGGRLISFSSSTALAGSHDRPAYAAAKGGVLSLALSLAAEFGSRGITSNCIIPRAATRMTDHVVSNLSGGEVAELPSAASKDGPLDPANVAPLVAYLLTDAASSINGQVFGAVGYQVAQLATASWVRSIERDQRWTVDDLSEAIPKALGTDLGYQPLTWEYRTEV